MRRRTGSQPDEPPALNELNRSHTPNNNSHPQQQQQQHRSGSNSQYESTIHHQHPPHGYPTGVTSAAAFGPAAGLATPGSLQSWIGGAAAPSSSSGAVFGPAAVSEPCLPLQEPSGGAPHRARGDSASRGTLPSSLTEPSSVAQLPTAWPVMPPGMPPPGWPPSAAAAGLYPGMLPPFAPPLPARDGGALPPMPPFPLPNGAAAGFPPMPPPPGGMFLPPPGAIGGFPFPPPPPGGFPSGLPPPPGFPPGGGTMPPNANPMMLAAYYPWLYAAAAAASGAAAGGQSALPSDDRHTSRTPTTRGGGDRRTTAPANLAPPPSALEQQRIRQLAAAAPRHFGGGMTTTAASGRVSPSPSTRALAALAAAGDGGQSSRHRHHGPAPSPGPSSLLADRRRALIDRHRNSVDLERSRLATSGSSRTARARTPLAANSDLRAASGHSRPAGAFSTSRFLADGRSSPSVTLKTLKGDTPNLRAAISNGFTPRYSNPSGGGAYSARRRASPSPSTRLVGASTLGVRADESGAAAASSFLGHQPLPEQQVQRSASSDDAAEGVDELYRRMRQAYVDFKRHPEQFAAAVASPMPANALAAHARAGGSPPRSSVQRAIPAPTPHTSVVAASMPYKMPLAAPEPSAESQRLRAELDRLEQQWMRLARLQGAGPEGGASSSTGTKTGDPLADKEAVVQHVREVRKAINTNAL